MPIGASLEKLWARIKKISSPFSLLSSESPAAVQDEVVINFTSFGNQKVQVKSFHLVQAENFLDKKKFVDFC